jgi:hypothetical protein
MRTRPVMAVKRDIDAIIDANIHQNRGIPLLVSRYADNWPENAFEKGNFEVPYSHDID